MSTEQFVCISFRSLGKAVAAICAVYYRSEIHRKKNGFSYISKAKLAKEEFPTRKYDNLVLEQGFYDALILDLGSGEGNNWWCVVYPPLCFLETSPTGENVVYKSKLVEIIKSFFN